MMADSDVEILPQGSVATLTSPVRVGVAQTECVHFWYHMGGENPGEYIPFTVHTHPQSHVTLCMLGPPEWRSGLRHRNA